MACTAPTVEMRQGSRIGSLEMTQTRNSRREARIIPVAREADQKAEEAKQNHNHPVTLDQFEREHMGIAAKE